jgi:hypothetical protein
MNVDATKASDFIAAVGSTSLKGKELFLFFKMNMIGKSLTALLQTTDPQKPSDPQLKLALTLADNMGLNMPESVRIFLKNAAGNTTTATFPASLNVSRYLEGPSELNILTHIGLAPGTAISSPSATTKSTTSASGSDLRDANADLDTDKTKNESFINVQPRKLILPADAPVWEKPDPNSRVLTTLKKGETVRVAGNISGWAVIDFKGTVAYIDLTLIS